jgi:uncharacterized membrane protein YqiK
MPDTHILYYIVLGVLALAFLFFLPRLLGIVYIPHTQIGVIEKLWSFSGSLREGQIIARGGEAGFQSKIQRGGIHFGLYSWQYRVHKQPLVTVGQGKIGYVFARDGEPLPPMQTLGQTVESNHFQDALAFLNGSGQRGRQRAILREGVYAINLALFVVITEDKVFSGPIRDDAETVYQQWRNQLEGMRGFQPVIIGSAGTAVLKDNEGTGLLPTDTIGVVSVQDGPTIGSGEIIAPEVKAHDGLPDHDYFQNPEAFLALGGKRGKQLQVLTDGTFFINRWFATIEIQAKTLVPIGYVGVVISYHGAEGDDVSGEAFRYGEQVEEGQRGVWRAALAPGKYALNPYAVKIEYVPTINFVLRWITNEVEDHRYDENLSSIELITADAYEPTLPLSLVVHIDYQKASSVIQRFGDVKRLIDQTLDPILTAYFRDVAQNCSMLDLLTKREDIQRQATVALGARFKEYDINCVAVLIGRPESKIKDGKEDPIERLFDQLRQRRLADEQKATYVKQQEAADNLRQFKQAEAAAAKQTELTQSKIDIEVAANRGEAQLAESERLAKRQIALAQGEATSKVTLAQGEATSKELLGKGEASRVAQIGLAEAAVTLQKVNAFRDPRLFALNLVAEQFSRSSQPLVPERLFITGGNGNGEGEGLNSSLVGQLLSLLVSEKSNIGIAAEGVNTEALQAVANQYAAKSAAVGNKESA